MDHDLPGKRVLVVGAGGGIDGATSRAFAACGARVTTAGRPGPRLDAITVDIGSTAAALDMEDNEAVEAFFAGSAPFDHVVVAAARTRSGPVSSLSLDDARASMDSKFWGAYRIARSPRIAEGGSLTLVSRFLSRRPRVGAVLQGAINAALERAPVRVNTVSAGLIDTPLWHGIAEANRANTFRGAAECQPASRVGQPEDITVAILFVATNPFATGTTVMVVGGGTIA